MINLSEWINLISGTVPGGIGLYLIIMLGIWVVLILAKIMSDSIHMNTFFKWGILGSTIIIGIFIVVRINYRLPPIPQRCWVQPFAYDFGTEIQAQQTGFAFEKSLEILSRSVVAFQSKFVSESFKQPVNPDSTAEISPLAKKMLAKYDIKGKISKQGKQLQLDLQIIELNRIGEEIKRDKISLSSENSFLLGYEAAQKFINLKKLKKQEKDRLQSYTAFLLDILYNSEKSMSKSAKEIILQECFKASDSSSVLIWEELAQLYVDWSYPSHKVDAEYAAKKAVELNDKSAIAYYVRGLIAWRLGGQMDVAIANWRLANIYDFRYIPLYQAYAKLPKLSRRGFTIKDKELIYQYAVSLRPANPGPRIVLANYYRKVLLLMKKSLGVLESGLEYNPMNLSLIMARGVYYIKSTEWENAKNDFLSILEQDSLDANVWYNLGIAERGLKNDSLALIAFEKSLKLNGNKDAHYYLGLIYEDRNDKENALKHHRQRWTKRNEFGDDLFARASRERIWMLLGKYDPYDVNSGADEIKKDQ